MRLTHALIAVLLVATAAGCDSGGNPLPGPGQDAKPDTAGADVAGDKTAPDTDLPCVPQCGGKECGDDGCGGKCGACEGDTICNHW